MKKFYRLIDASAIRCGIDFSAYPNLSVQARARTIYLFQLIFIIMWSPYAIFDYLTETYINFAGDILGIITAITGILILRGGANPISAGIVSNFGGITALFVSFMGTGGILSSSIPFMFIGITGFFLQAGRKYGFYFTVYALVLLGFTFFWDILELPYINQLPFELYSVEYKQMFAVSWYLSLIAVAFITSIYERNYHKGLKQIQKERHAAENATQSKSDFLANMSHEIRTPMNGVIGLTELLLDTKTTKEQRDMLEAIKFSGDSLLSLINDILDFSKIEAGKLDFDIQSFDLQYVLEQFAGVAQLRCEENGLDFNYKTEETKRVFYKGDVSRINQILNNLVGNAIKFTDKGSIALSYAVVQDTLLRSTLRFSISDTGIGISKENQEKLFEKFMQADKTIVTTFGGTGLGLSITNELVALMDGKIGVESTLGEGSMFWFTIALEKTKKLYTKQDEQRNDDVFCATPASILLVEDNVINQKVALKMLKKAGYDVMLACDGKEAIARLKEHYFDIVLMDVQMPVMGGVEATSIIRNQSSELKNSNPYISAMTANAMKGDREKYLSCGMNDYIEKPVSQKTVLGVIQRWSNFNKES